MSATKKTVRIEITPAMVLAGVRALLSYNEDDDEDDVVKAIFCAMIGGLEEPAIGVQLGELS